MCVYLGNYTDKYLCSDSLRVWTDCGSTVLITQTPQDIAQLNHVHISAYIVIGYSYLSVSKGYVMNLGSNGISGSALLYFTRHTKSDLNETI